MNSSTTKKRNSIIVTAILLCVCCSAAIIFLLRIYFQTAAETKTYRLEKARYALRVGDALNADNTQNFRRAKFPANIQFPKDHGLHTDFKTEWWYFTGNLQTASGREFGYQLTFFRSALAPNAEIHEHDANGDGFRSAWATRHIFMGHFAVTDKQSGAFFHAERFARMNAKLAGCDLSFIANRDEPNTRNPSPFKVWLYDWNVSADSLQTKNPRLQDISGGGKRGETIFPLRLQATLSPEETGGKEIELTLILDSLKPVVLQGENGYSPKSTSGANASYYYSHARLQTRGEIRIGAETLALEGLSWLDREWSTSALEKNQTGWDWFSLQLDDGRDLMFYRLRQKSKNGEIVADSASAGVIIEKDGSTRKLLFQDVLLTPETFWQSPVPLSGAPASAKRFPVYPSVWRLSAPSQNLELTLTPILPNQELLTSVRYWEGSVIVRGTQNSTTIRGKGYVEMTGYTDE